MYKALHFNAVIESSAAQGSGQCDYNEGDVVTDLDVLPEKGRIAIASIENFPFLLRCDMLKGKVLHLPIRLNSCKVSS